jgi:hypothetical protein
MKKLRKNEFGFSVVEVALVIVILALLGLTSWAVDKSHHKVTVTPTTSAKTQNSTNDYTQAPDNISRKQDASVIEATISNYIDNNSGELPQSTAVGSTPHILDICGVSCNSGDVEPTGLSLSIYAPSAVSFQPYSNGLTVPDAQTVYIVDKASCNNSGTNLLPPVNMNSVAVLYALQDGSNIEQICQEV